MDKKYTLTLFAIFKNESHIIKEWLEHYINEGVEHFWLIDNGSTDDYESEIQPFMDNITLFKDSTPHNQSPLYNKYILPKLNHTEWIIGCDLDEFIWSTKGTIKDILKEVDQKVGLIQIPWEQFGSSGHIKQPKKVVESFLYRKGGNYTSEQKCIGRSEAILEFGVHFFEIKDGYITVNSLLEPHEKGFYTEMSEELLKKAKLRLAHYQIQSYEWYKNVKMTRGDVAFETHGRDENYFKQRDTNDIFDDNLYKKKYYHHSNKEWNIWYWVSFFFLFSLLLFFVLMKSQKT